MPSKNVVKVFSDKAIIADSFNMYLKRFLLSFVCYYNSYYRVGSWVEKGSSVFTVGI